MLLQKLVSRIALPADLVVVGTMILSAIVGLLVYRVVEGPLLRIGQQLVRELVQKSRAAASQTPRPIRGRDANRRGSLPGPQQR